MGSSCSRGDGGGAEPRQNDERKRQPKRTKSLPISANQPTASTQSLSPQRPPMTSEDAPTVVSFDAGGLGGSPSTASIGNTHSTRQHIISGNSDVPLSHNSVDGDRNATFPTATQQHTLATVTNPLVPPMHPSSTVLHTAGIDLTVPALTPSGLIATDKIPANHSYPPIQQTPPNLSIYGLMNSDEDHMSLDVGKGPSAHTKETAVTRSSNDPLERSDCFLEIGAACFITVSHNAALLEQHTTHTTQPVNAVKGMSRPPSNDEQETADFAADNSTAASTPRIATLVAITPHDARRHGIDVCRFYNQAMHNHYSQGMVEVSPAASLSLEAQHSVVAPLASESASAAPVSSQGRKHFLLPPPVPSSQHQLHGATLFQSPVFSYQSPQAFPRHCSPEAAGAGSTAPNSTHHHVIVAMVSPNSGPGSLPTPVNCGPLGGPTAEYRLVSPSPHRLSLGLTTQHHFRLSMSAGGEGVGCGTHIEAHRRFSSTEVSGHSPLTSRRDSVDTPPDESSGTIAEEGGLHRAKEGFRIQRNSPLAAMHLSLGKEFQQHILTSIPRFPNNHLHHHRRSVVESSHFASRQTSSDCLDGNGNGGDFAATTSMTSTALFIPANLLTNEQLMGLHECQRVSPNNSVGGMILLLHALDSEAFGDMVTSAAVQSMQSSTSLPTRLQQ